ncbi:MAG: hypothetical protein WC665_02310 [Sulfurimonas sp.]|jgi:WD40 repeat protein
MFDLITSIRVDSSILSMRISDEKVMLLTNQYLLLVYSKNSFKVLEKKHLSSEFETRHVYEKSFALSPKMDIFFTASNSPKSFLLRNRDDLQNMETLSFHRKPVSCAKFNNASDIIAIGGEDGKVFFYSLLDNNIVASLKTRPDYISNITFSKDDKFASISSFDKTNAIYSFDRACETRSFVSADVIEKSIFVEDNSKLICISRNKKLIQFDLQTNATLVSEFLFEEWPTCILEIASSYILVGTKGKYLYLVNYEKMEILSTITLDNSGVTLLKIFAGELYISFIDGEIKVINLNSNLEQFILNLKLNKFHEASQLIENNIFLVIHESAKKFDEVWNDTLSDAKKLLASNQKDEAKKLVIPFFFNKSKHDEYMFCLGHIEHYTLFTKLIEEKKYIKAFQAADEKEFLKKTKDYESLEKYFIKIFHNCKLLFTKGDLQSIAKARDTLKDFALIKSKKELITNLLLRYKVFVSADNLIKERKFKLYFILVRQNKFLEDEEIYNRVLLIGNQTFSKLLIYEQEQNYTKALEIAGYLKDFLPLTQRVEQKINVLNIKQSLYKNIMDNNISMVYNVVEKESEFETFLPFIEFHERFLNLKRNAHEIAKYGDAVGLLRVFEEYMNLEYTIHLIAQEFKIAYLAQIDKAISSISIKKIDWIESLKMYESYFGLDNELVCLSDTFNLSDYMIKVNNSGKFDGYKNKKFTDSVIVHIV